VWLKVVTFLQLFFMANCSAVTAWLASSHRDLLSGFVDRQQERFPAFCTDSTDRAIFQANLPGCATIQITAQWSAPARQ
jgi:hypothetical protein